MAKSGMLRLLSSASACLMVSLRSVQSASSGTTPLRSTRSRTFSRLMAALRFHLHVGHQLAVKSTSTVLPSARAAASAAGL